MRLNMNYPCPCYGYLTFIEEVCGTFEICPICFWKDDSTQSKVPNYEGGANEISLLKARKNFAKYGVVQEKFMGKVRKAFFEETP